MYAELRRRRGLGARGRLAPPNEDLLALPRAAVVASLSALDAYIHAVLYEQLPIAMRRTPPPIALCNALAEIVQIKNGTSFQEALPIILAADSAVELSTRFKEEKLAFASYQQPDKIVTAYALIGQPNIFHSVADLWQGPNTTEHHLKRILSGYAKRRNQIAHEGDRDAQGHPRHMQPLYAAQCRDFISGLAARLNRVVYGV